MKKAKRIISSVLAVLMVLSVWSTGFTSTVNAAVEPSKAVGGTQENGMQTLLRPEVDFYCTEITRVAKAVDSTEPGTTIVKATPSGVPELTSANASKAYAGETPSATRVTFVAKTSEITGVAITCSNETVVLSDIVKADENTYYVDVVSGTASVGEAIDFTVSYTWTDGRKYQNKCVTYVESIVTGGAYASIQASFRPWGGTNSYFNNYSSAYTRLLGEGVYYEHQNIVATDSMTYGNFLYNAGNLYNVNNLSGYNTSIFTYSHIPSVSGASKDVSYETFVPGVAMAHVYIDASTTKSLADINLRLDAMVGELSDRNNDNPYTALADAFVYSGSVTEQPSSYVNDATAQQTIGYTIPAKSDKGVKQSEENSTFETITGPVAQYENIYTNGFTGSIENIVDNSSFSIVNRYYAYQYAEEGLMKRSNMTSSAYVSTPITFHIRDKSVLREAIDYVLNSEPTTPAVRNTLKGANPQSWYYKSGFQAFQTSYVEALRVLNNPKATQDEIEASAKGLKTSYNSLVLAGADYTKVNELYDEANEMLARTDWYQQSDLEKLAEAQSAVKKGYNILYQPEVDKMAENLEKAMKIQPVAADYNRIVELEIEFANLDKSLYTPESIKAVEDAFAKVDYTLDATQSAIVDGYVADIEAAMAALETKKADFTTLEQYVEESKAVNADLYLNASLLITPTRNAENAIAEHKADPWLEARQPEVDELAAQLKKALDALTPKNALLEELEKAINLQLDGELKYYDQTLLEEFYALVEEGTEMYNDKTLTRLDQTKIDAKTAEINAKYEELCLSYNEPADKDALEAAINKEIPGNRDYYDPEVLAEYDKLLEDAVAMNNDPTVNSLKQHLVDDMVAALTEKYDALMLTYVIPADKDYLKVAIEEALKVNLDNYFDGAEKDEFNAALSEGQAINADRTVSEDDQAIVDNSVARINAAKENLKIKPADLDSFNLLKELVEAKKAETVDVVTYIDGVLANEAKAKYDVSAIEEKINAFDVSDVTIENQAEINAFVNETKAEVEALEALAYAEYYDVAVEEYNATEEVLYTPDSVQAYKTACDEIIANVDLSSQASINDAVTAIVNAKVVLKIAASFEAKEGTMTVVDKEKGFIYGLEEGLVDLENYVTYTGGELVYEESANGFGTGTVVNFVVNGEVKETYEIIIFGDLNGDGVVDAFDYSIMASVANGDLEFEETSAYFKAADLAVDGAVDTFDLTFIAAAVVGETIVNQCPELA